ncbi:MAG TPA: DNA-deoxyinosine glycosylase [Bacilli bacterium]|nr:DNA-deoxyinosine glycosylase [Bacilli bacterium]
MKSEIRSLAHPFPLLYDTNSRVLILGSFPSVKAVAEGYYYANPHNRFYKVMSALFDEDFINVPWKSKRIILLKHHIALHDAIGHCQILGSSDAKIRDVKPSNIREIFAHATIQKVICNGAKAYQEYVRFFSDVKIPVVQVPSTSPANAKMRLDDLVDAWRDAIRDIVFK